MSIKKSVFIFLGLALLAIFNVFSGRDIYELLVIGGLIFLVWISVRMMERVIGAIGKSQLLAMVDQNAKLSAASLYLINTLLVALIVFIWGIGTGDLNYYVFITTPIYYIFYHLLFSIPFIIYYFAKRRNKSIIPYSEFSPFEKSSLSVLFVTLLLIFLFVIWMGLGARGFDAGVEGWGAFALVGFLGSLLIVLYVIILIVNIRGLFLNDKRALFLLMIILMLGALEVLRSYWTVITTGSSLG